MASGVGKLGSARCPEATTLSPHAHGSMHRRSPLLTRRHPSIPERRRPGANDRRPNDHTRRTQLGHAHPRRAIPVLCPHLLAARDDTIRTLHSTPHTEKARPTSNVQMIRYVVHRTCADADTIRMAPSHLIYDRERSPRRSGAGRRGRSIQQPKLPCIGRPPATRRRIGRLAPGGRVFLKIKRGEQTTVSVNDWPRPSARPLMLNCLPDIMRFHCTSEHTCTYMRRQPLCCAGAAAVCVHDRTGAGGVQRGSMYRTSWCFARGSRRWCRLTRNAAGSSMRAPLLRRPAQ